MEIMRRIFYCLIFLFFVSTFMDIIAPVGNVSDEIGTGRWIIAPGLATAMMFSESIQVFPVLSYQYMSKSKTGDTTLIHEPMNGITLQFIGVWAMSEKAFITVTPILNQLYVI
jgi:hypothetical protein